MTEVVIKILHLQGSAGANRVLLDNYCCP